MIERRPGVPAETSPRGGSGRSDGQQETAPADGSAVLPTSVGAPDLEAHPVLVVDFGAQYAQLIARRVREANVYSEIVPSTITAAEIAAIAPAAVILSGGPSSVYDENAPHLDPALFDTDVPVFGICYGFQAMAAALGGSVDRTGRREYGATQLRVTAPDGALLRDLPSTLGVWMSHGDAVSAAPPGFAVTAATADTPIAAFENLDRRLAGVQYHPEVAHSQFGQEVLRRFLHDIAGISPDWTPAEILHEQVDAIRAKVGDERVICGLSGGVDSAVAAALVQRAVGDQLTCVFVDHGLLRAGEREQVERDYVAATGINLVTVDASERFLSALAGVIFFIYCRTTAPAFFKKQTLTRATPTLVPDE